MTPIDAAWRAAHPLPEHRDGTDKNDRGRVLAVGAGRSVPGALRLTGEAALRAGAGKVQLATTAAVALPLGIAFPEAGIVPLPEDGDGEIGGDAVSILAKSATHCDMLVIGPGMHRRRSTSDLVAGMLAADLGVLAVLLDAGATACADDHEAAIGSHAGPLVLTPHHGEMAALTGEPIARIADDPAAAAARAAARFNAIIVLKGGDTIVAAPAGERLHYTGGGVGLATGGSGDVLAGVIAGLIARGTDPVEAAAWGVWLHGEAGRMLAARHGRIGLLAREIPAEVPRLMAAG